MRTLSKWFSLVLLAAAGWSAHAALPPDLGQRLAEQYARPAFGRLLDTAGRLESAVARWCERDAPDGALQVRKAYGQLAQAWAGVEFLRFGPLVSGNRYERLAFWPDPRGVVLRQVQAALAQRDPELLAEGALAARSVALQGLPALEFVLYRDDGVLARPAGAGFVYECGYARAVAANVRAVAGELVQAWSAQGDFGRQFAQPREANDLYRNSQEVAAEAMKALSTGLQFARDVKLLPVLGASAQDAKPRRAAFWRSGQTLPTLEAGLQGMAAFQQIAATALPEDGRWAGESVSGELARARQAVAAASGTIETAAVEPAPRGQLELLALILKNAKDIVDQDLAPALGVTIGFNALDGD
ncbi:imelysin family protein [Bordetella sp. 2513F-2]